MPKQNALEIDLDPELRSAFVAAAESAHRSTDDLLRELVQDYVDAQHEEPGQQQRRVHRRASHSWRRRA